VLVKKEQMHHLRWKICLYTEASIPFSLLFGFFENEFLDVAVNLVLLYVVGDRRAHLGAYETRYDRR